MKTSELTLLMHAVLDGEAAPGDVRELERRLAADPAARAEFDELRRLFDGLAGVPKEFPPEGLYASVMANVPRPAARPRRFDQLFVVVGCNWASFQGNPGHASGTNGNGPPGFPTRAIFQE